MNIQMIQVGKKKWPIKYGFESLVEMQDFLPGDDELSIENMGQIAKLPVRFYPDFILAGVKLGCKLMNKKEVPDRDDIVAAMNHDFKGVYMEAMQVFAADMGAEDTSQEENSQAEQEPVSSVAGEAEQSGN